MSSDDTPPLFRPAALDAQKDLLLGKPGIALPLRTTVMTYLLTLCAAAAVCGLIWGSYTRRVSVTGQIQPGQQVLRIQAGQSGQVMLRHVEQGDAVEAGQALFTLTRERTGEDGPTQQRIAETMAARLQSFGATDQALRRLVAMQEADLARRLALLTAEIARAVGEAGLLARRRALALKTRARFAGLADAGFVSPAQLQQKEEELLDAERACLGQSRQLDGMRREHARLASARAELPVQHANQRQELQRAMEALRQDMAQHQSGHRWKITAPQAGTIAAVNAAAGGAVAPEHTLAVLVPAGARIEAHLYAPSRAIGFVRPGTRVKLRLDAFPYQKFGHVGGTVDSVARSALHGQEIEGMGHTNEPLYRIRVRLDQTTIRAYGHALPLLPSMRLEADLLLERRRLYEWVLEPLYSVKGKL